MMMDLIAAVASFTSIVPKPMLASNSKIRKVYVVFKCHFDVGFTGTQAEVVRRYFDLYFPRAIERAEAQAETAPLGYVWTVGSWLLYEYLEQASTKWRQRMDAMVRQGSIAWHALPFTYQSEMLDRSLFEASLSLSVELDRRYGCRTIAAKMTDVPGQTRGIVAPLSDAGVTLLDIGVNPASTPPHVPPVFRWCEPGGNELTVLYHPHDYGGTQVIPGSDVAVAVEVRADNAGLHSSEEIAAIYARLRSEFPQATVQAASLSTVADAVNAFQEHFPVVTSEIGDSWIYGCASDPVKIARFRELSRLRCEWVASGTLRPGDAIDRAWLPALTLAAEHTWGIDTKSALESVSAFTPHDLAVARKATESIQRMESAWQEKRDNLDYAVACLPEALQAEAEHRLENLKPSAVARRKNVALPVTGMVETRHFTLAFSQKTGALEHLIDRRTGRVWATPKNTLAFFQYQTFNAADYRRFLEQYLVLDDWWPPLDFGKPGIETLPLKSRTYAPRLQSIEHDFDPAAAEHRIVVELTMPDGGDQADYLGWPKRVTMEWRLPNDSPSLYLDLQCFRKPANRLPEAMWLSFQPSGVTSEGWRFDKINQSVDPCDVVSHGGRSLHAVTRGVCWMGEAEAQFDLETLDAPLVAPGRCSLLNFDDALPDMRHGVHVNLFNNVWGTNYVQWLDDDLRFRFVLRL